MGSTSNRPPRGPRPLVDYALALDAQRRLVEQRAGGQIPDTLWLLEHPRVITWGRGAQGANLLLPAAEIRALGVGLHGTERGGDVTCHEPGQLVGYPVVDLGQSDADRDLHLYLRRLEGALGAVLCGLGLASRTIAGRTGLWLDGTPPRKVAAIGVRCARWITSHGFALNVANTLDGFGYIVPCGLPDAPVTSLARELGAGALPDWEDLRRRVHVELERALDRPLRLLRDLEALAGFCA